MILVSMSTSLSPFVIVPQAEAYVISISRQPLPVEEPAKKGRRSVCGNIWSRLQETFYSHAQNVLLALFIHEH